MEHSDELTFAEYFKSRYDLFRGLITFVVAMQWLIDHDFAEPTDRDARLMDIEVSRQMCDVRGELYAGMAGRPITPGRLRIVTCCWI